jgi:hypothetical protein
VLAKLARPPAIAFTVGLKGLFDWHIGGTKRHRR